MAQYNENPNFKNTNDVSQYLLIEAFILNPFELDIQALLLISIFL